MCTLCASEQGKPALDEDSGRLGIQNMDGWVRSEFRLSAKCLISRKLFARDDVRQRQKGKPQYVGVQRVVSRAPLQRGEWEWDKGWSHFQHYKRWGSKVEFKELHQRIDEKRKDGICPEEFVA